MGRITANEEVWVGFLPTIADANLNPTAAEITGGTDLTGFLVTLDASTRGNNIATPSLDTLFETSIPGTAAATFTAEFYRDDTTDTAWTTLPRGTQGYFVIERYGSAGAAPVAADVVEVWPIRVLTRSAVALTSNDSQRFQIECAVDVEPNEAATVSA